MPTIRDYIEMAGRHGYIVESVDMKPRKHAKATIIGPRGVLFTCHMPKTSSSKEGPRNFVCSLKKGENKAWELEEKNAMTLQERKEARASIIKRLIAGEELFFVPSQKAWHISATGGISNRPWSGIKKAPVEEMINEGLLEQGLKTDNKQFWILSEKGLSLCRVVEPEPEIPRADLAPSSAQEMVLTIQEEKEETGLDLAKKILEGLTKDEIRLVLYSGLAELEKDLMIKKDLIQRKVRLL